MSIYFKATLVAASLAAALSVAAQPMSAASAAVADCPANTDCRMGKQRHGARQARRSIMTAEQRMARFDSLAAQQAQALQITAAQRPQWDAYVQAKKSFFAARRPDMPRQNMSSMAADERAELRARHLETAAQQARQLANSTKALRDVLTPEQRNHFDQMSLHHGPRHFRSSNKRHRPMMQGVDAKQTPAAEPTACAEPMEHRLHQFISRAKQAAKRATKNRQALQRVGFSVMPC